jgi:hypothetical protein
MTADLIPNDILSRFLDSESRINRELRILKTSAFTDKHPKGFSVFMTTNLSENSIWDIAYKYVIKPDSEKPLLGRGDLEVKFYLEANLEIKKDEPPSRHYNIFGMPIDSGLRDAEGLSMRQKMSANSRFIPIPS